MRKILYDKDADALIVVVSDKKLEYEEKTDNLIVGFSKDNEPIFLPEVINKIVESGVQIKLIQG